MSTTAVVVIVLMAGFAAMLAVIVWYARGQSNTAFQWGVESGTALAAKEALLAVRARGRRYEIQVRPGPHPLDITNDNLVAFRWYIWDADRFLDPEFAEAAKRGEMVPPVAASAAPHMTPQEAYMGAHEWLEAQGIHNAVVVGR